MSKPLKPRRGTTAEQNAFVGEAYEVTYDTDKNTLVCRDGLTAGGFPLAHEADVAAKTSSLDSTLRALIAEEVAKLLPLAGGTMTAGITFAVNNGLNVITATNANSYLQFCGGTGYADGASVAVYGEGSGSRTGAFVCNTAGGNASKNLVGYPDGRLIWGNNNVVLSVNGSAADASGKVTIQTVSSVDGAAGAVSTASEIGSNYIRFSNGLQICWDTVSKPASAYSVDWTFPKAFSSAPRASITIIGSGTESFDYLAKAYFTANSATSLRVRTNVNNSAVAFHAIVVGLWK